MMYQAIQCRQGEPTGRVEYYLAGTIKDAVSFVRYAHNLSAPTTVGPTSRVVYSRGFAYVVAPL